MKPITRKEYYLAKAAGTYTGPTPPPVLREDYYLATLSGDYSGNCPAPVTRLDMFMSAAAGLTSYVPQPVTRIEKYWYAIAKGTGYVPEPVTREEQLLYAIIHKEPQYIDKTAEGSLILLPDSAEASFTALTIYGHSKQSGTPSPENPVPIVSAGDSGEIETKVYGGNLISSDISSWNSSGWGYFNDRVFQLSDGIKIKTVNGWINVYYDTSEMNGKTLNFSFDYQQIESETTSPSTSYAFAIVVQNENKYPNEVSDIYLFQIESPETVKTHVSVSFTARNYLCFFLRVNTEGVEAGERRTIEVTNIMLNAGNAELAYEPYKTPQSIVLSTPNGLPGIPVNSGGNYTDESGQQWVCDEVDFERGVYVQRLNKKILTSVLPWNFGLTTGNGNNNFQIRLTSEESATGLHGGKPTNSMCNFLKYAGLLWDDSEINLPKIYANALEITASFPPDSEVNSLQKWNELLDGIGNCYIYYILDTPIETDLPAEEISAYKALHTYSPTTTVSNDAGAWMKMGYKATP